jgi:hypothetical protein
MIDLKQLDNDPWSTTPVKKNDLRALVAAVTWQPIETAPKDRIILVTGANGLRIDQVIWGGWELDNTHNWCDADGDRHPNAAITHWMPLPEPPKEGL